MLKKLRLWHFDVAIFAGLALFGWAYWSCVPRPERLGQPVINDSSRNRQCDLLCLSHDDRVLYCLAREYNNAGKTINVVIEKWSTTTGEQSESIPLAFSEDEKRAEVGIVIHSSFNLPVIESQWLSGENKNIWHRRYYSGLDGKCLSEGVDSTWLNTPANAFLVNRVLPQPAVDGHRWALRWYLNVAHEANLMDLETGKKLHTFPAHPTDRIGMGLLSPHGTYYLQTWSTGKGKADYEVFRTSNWESLGRYHINDHITAFGIYWLNETSWAFVSYVQVDSNSAMLHSQLQFFRFDPEKRTLTPDHTNPHDGLVTPGQIYVNSPFIILTGEEVASRSSSVILNKLEDLLARIGIHRDYSSGSYIQVMDLASGHPLRQISKLKNQNHRMSHDCHYLFAIEERENEYQFCRYTIPHYLWDPTLSWIQWLSWLLVAPWPLRYFLPQPCSPRRIAGGLKV